jgi:hypothetical protein
MISKLCKYPVVSMLSKNWGRRNPFWTFAWFFSLKPLKIS